MPVLEWNKWKPVTLLWRRTIYSPIFATLSSINIVDRNMTSNIEIKAKVRPEVGLQQAEAIAIALSDNGKICQKLHQVDTFFKVPHGRMKLREEDNRSVLISYARDDVAGPKQSRYSMVVVPEPGKMLQVLSASLEIKGTVAKERKVYLVKQKKTDGLEARIHLDRVRFLGDFLEFEVVLPKGDEAELEEGKLFANELITKFDIKTEDLMECAYLDLLQ